MIHAAFWERDFSHLKTIPYDVVVKRYSWNVFGGPEEMTCTIDFSGANDSLLWSMVANLRCPVWVVDNVGRVVWWGYVHTVNVTNSARTYGVSIDTMFNRVKATYELLIAGDTDGVRGDTVWVQDAFSIAEFGTREKVYPLITVSIAAAEADTYVRLEKSKFPVAIADLAIRQDQGKSVEFICKGWWYSMDWIYYENTGTTYIELATLLDTMLNDAEFVVGVRSQIAATTLTPEYRKGDQLLRSEAEQLMNIGTDNNLRILATMTKERYVILTEEPDKDGFIFEPFYLDRDNQLYDTYGSKVDATLCKVGVWAVLRDFEGIPYATRTMIPPSPVFIERATYDCETGIYQPEQRGYKSPYDEIQDIQR